jgi:IS5 family transposase
VLVLEGSPDILFDELLPEEVKVLSAELAAVDALLDDPAILACFRNRWEATALRHGRPTIPMATYLRLMYVKHTTGSGYERLMAEVSDSLSLRRFCHIAVIEEVPDESTIRKLTRRLGHEVVDEATRAVIKEATGNRRFRPRALRVDSTVAAADIRYPTDVGLCADAVRTLARMARTVHHAVPDATAHVVDRSRSVAKRVRAIGRSLRRRTGQAKAVVQAMTEQSAVRVTRSVREASTLLAQAQASTAIAPGVSAKARARAIADLETVIALSGRVTAQIRARFAGKKIPDRLVSLFDADARPVRRGKLSTPNEFGYVVQLAEVTPSTKHGAKALLLPPKLRAGSTHENALLPETAAELDALGITPKEAAVDAGFIRADTEKALPGIGRIFIAGSKENTGSQRTRRRLAKFRVGCEGRISDFKREHHGGRCRLKGNAGAHIWESWSVLGYDVQTVAGLPARPDTG